MTPSTADLALRLTTRGRGVFARRSFEASELLECCAVLLVENSSTNGQLDEYVYAWEDQCAIATGFGSFYNHSYEPNVRYTRDLERRQMLYTALRPIASGEELTINYNGDPASREAVWFDVLPPTPRDR